MRFELVLLFLTMEFWEDFPFCIFVSDGSPPPLQCMFRVVERPKLGSNNVCHMRKLSGNQGVERNVSHRLQRWSRAPCLMMPCSDFLGFSSNFQNQRGWTCSNMSCAKMWFRFRSDLTRYDIKRVVNWWRNKRYAAWLWQMTGLWSSKC